LSRSQAASAGAAAICFSASCGLDLSVASAGKFARLRRVLALARSCGDLVAWSLCKACLDVEATSLVPLERISHARVGSSVTGRFGPPYGEDIPGVNFVVTDVVMYVVSGVIYAAGGIVGR
jgi:hypothetical protein